MLNIALFEPLEMLKMHNMVEHITFKKTLVLDLLYQDFSLIPQTGIVLFPVYCM